MKRILNLTLLFAMVCSVALAQAPQRIGGVVYDEFNEPLIGATVVVKGSSRGASTDINGKFSLEAEPTDEIVVSYLGYNDYEQAVGNRTEFVITMSNDAQQISEVVVTAHYSIRVDCLPYASKND